MVLITNGKHLNLALWNFLADQKIRHVTIIGGSKVVSADVEDQLKVTGIIVNRIIGATSDET